MPPFVDPPQWTDEQLEQDRQTSIARFVDERSTVLGPRYQQTLLKNISFVRSLFEASNDLRELASGTALAAQPSLIDVARYLAGPPISQDVFDVLAGTSIAKRKRLDAGLAREAAELLESALDRYRFPWLFASPSRPPTAAEREAAIGWTAGLNTTTLSRQDESKRRRRVRLRWE